GGGLAEEFVRQAAGVPVGERRRRSARGAGAAAHNLISKAAYRNDLRRELTAATELDAQTSDVDVDGPAGARVGITPHQLGQCVARDDLIRAGSEYGQQAILGRRELQDDASEGYLMQGMIDQQFADAN